MIINMRLNDSGVIALVSKSGDDQIYAQEFYHCIDRDEWGNAFRSVLNRLSEKTSLNNVRMINLSAKCDHSNVDETTTLDVLESSLARSLDMPCVPIFMTQA